MSEKVTEINKPEDNEMKLKLSKEYDFEGQKIDRKSVGRERVCGMV